MNRLRDVCLGLSLLLLGTVFGLLAAGRLTLAPAARNAGVPGTESMTTADPRSGRAVTSYADVVDQAAASVVYIFTTKRVSESALGPLFSQDPVMRRFFGSRRRERVEEGLGSGVIVSSGGYLLTNNHVIEGADEVQVVLAGSGEEYTAQVVGRDPQTDIAVLKIEATGLPAIQMGDSETLRVGDVVLAIGNPFGVGQSVTLGIVGALGRGGFGINDYEDFIQTDAPINPGNSGGALVDGEGRLVGINTAILSRSGGSQGIGFSVPIRMAQDVMKKIIQYGRVTRGYLGVALETVTPKTARELRLPVASGAIISELGSGSPAATAGLRPGDLIVQVDGTRIVESRNLRLIISATSPGTEVSVKYYRGNDALETRIRLAELQANQTADSESTTEAPPAPQSVNPLDGVQITELDRQVRGRYRIPNTVFGILVAGVQEGTPAHQSGLRAGHVIVEINRLPVRNTREALLVARQPIGEQALLTLWQSGRTGYLVIEPH